MLNYDSLANIDDGTCIPIVYGCMDDGVLIDYDGDGIAALNYDPLANVEIAGSCIPYSFGCMDTTMWNYDPLAQLRSYFIQKISSSAFGNGSFATA